MASSTPNRKHKDSVFIDLFLNDETARDNFHLMALARAIDRTELESAFAPLYSDKGRKAKSIRLMCGLLILKQPVLGAIYENRGPKRQ